MPPYEESWLLLILGWGPTVVLETACDAYEPPLLQKGVLYGIKSIMHAEHRPIVWQGQQGQ